MDYREPEPARPSGPKLDQLPPNTSDRILSNSDELIENKTRYTRFWDTETRSLLSGEDAISVAQSRLSAADLDAHLANGSMFSPRPDRLRPVVGLLPIPPRTVWETDGSQLSFFRPFGNVRRPARAGMRVLEHIFAAYAHHFRSRTIAIDLSGGLDSSIVIGLLSALGARVLLVGHVSERYEFRTERSIQQFLVDRHSSLAPGNISVLIPDDSALPFSALDKVPSSAWPRHTNIYHAGHLLSAKAASEHGANIFLNGNGADALFCDQLDAELDQLPSEYQGWNLDDPWPNDIIYRPLGIRYTSAFSLGRIPAVLYAMRKLENEDAQKIWARQTFSSFIPRELRNYAYKADFAGWFQDGLLAARRDIQRLSNAVYKEVPHPDIEPSLIDHEIADYPHLEDENWRNRLSMKISFIAWAYSLMDKQCGRPSNAAPEEQESKV